MCVDRACGLFERGEALGAGIDQTKLGGIPGRKCIKLVDRNIVLARRCPQREQALLDLLEFTRVVVGRVQCRIEMSARVIERRERGIERLHRRFDQRRSLGGAALQPAHRCGQQGDGRLRSCHCVVAPPGLDYPRDVQIWTPNPYPGGMELVARLKPGVNQITLQ